MKNRFILSLGTNHDTGVAVYRRGSQDFSASRLFCVNEERLNREKLTRRFPEKSIKAAARFLDAGGALPEKVLVASEFTPIFLLKLLGRYYSRLKLENQFSYMLGVYVAYQSILMKIKLLRDIDMFLSRLFYAKKLGIDKKDILFFEHHHCHAAAAHYSSGYDSTLVITIDMMGDGVTLSVNKGTGKSVKRIFSQSGFSGIAAFYSKITQLCGFRPNRHEGKITGLASYGRPKAKLTKLVKGLFLFDKKTGGFTEVNYLFGLRKAYLDYNKLRRFKKEDIAAAAQLHLEQEVCRFTSYWLRKTGMRNLCLAGGLFANVKLNQRLHELKEVDNIFIFPAMGDGGLAFGALMAYLKPEPFKLENAFLGLGFSDDEIKKELDRQKVDYEYCSNIEQRIAKLLSKGMVVARFDGRMEFGPRALGNRSILYQPTDRSVNDWLNKRLKRTEFMPFAPVTLAEYSDKCYKNFKGAEHAAEFMTITFDCTGWMKKKCPGVVHVDGTARPQIVSRKNNPSLYRIVDEYRRITGIPCIINTSFNMHEEPIVCTPKEAIRTFRLGHLDYLAIGNYLLKKSKKG